MRAAAALGFLLVLGVWVGHALAASPGPTQLPTTSLPITTALPTLPTTTLPGLPTTTVPKLPTTTTVPRLPTTTTVPKLPTTTTVPAPPPATTSVPQIVSNAATTVAGATSSPSVQSAARTAGSGTSSAGLGAGYSGAEGSGSQASPGSPAAQGIKPSRPYVAQSGPKSRRHVILSFALRQGGRVYFVVKQVAPNCLVVGRFSVRGHQGVNRVRFTGKVAGKRLSAGTYLISATTRHSARVLRVILVVVERGTPTPAALRAARAANVCQPETFLAGAPGIGATSGTGFTKSWQPGLDTSLPGSGTEDDSTSKSAGAVLGAALERAASEAVKPLAVTLLAMAILLLGLAAAPKAVVPGARLNDALVRHRPEIAAAGAAAMVTGILYFLIS
jgi:hypothetical protein